MKLLLTLSSGPGRRQAAPGIGFLAILFLFAQCQPEPVGAPPPSTDTREVFEPVWSHPLGDSLKLRYEDFNEKLVVTQGQLFFFSFNYATFTRRALSYDLESGQLLVDTTNIPPDDAFLLGGEPLTQYFETHSDQLLAMHLPTQTRQIIGPYLELYPPADRRLIAFRGGQEMIEIYLRRRPRVFHFMRYDLTTGQFLDSATVPFSSSSFTVKEWQTTPVWTSTDGVPYLVLYHGRRAFYLHAETFAVLDSVYSGPAFQAGNFAENRLYLEDTLSEAFRAYQMPGRQLLWEQPQLRGENYHLDIAGDFLMVCHGSLDLYDKRSGQFRWTTLQPLFSCLYDHTITAGPYLARYNRSSAYSTEYDPLQILDPTTGQVLQKLDMQGHVNSIRYHAPSRTLLVLTSQGIFAYRRSP